MERQAAITLMGNQQTLVGPEIKTGDTAPDFKMVDNALKPVTLGDTQGVRIFSVLPSLDTPVCDAQTRRFNEEAASNGQRSAPEKSPKHPRESSQNKGLSRVFHATGR